ncbi:MAG: hypothetical protein FWG87_09940 [Defluviitaleaceae bacterium]|nr:hypothetical protein [Defluviitaleaceae bacterium]
MLEARKVFCDEALRQKDRKHSAVFGLNNYLRIMARQTHKKRQKRVASSVLKGIADLSDSRASHGFNGFSRITRIGS